MYKDKKILAIIPARGNSKGLPGKNIRLLNDKPLINWSIDILKEVQIVDRIFVSTDSESIATVAKANNIDIPFLRNQNLATDNSLVIDAVLETINYFQNQGELYDVILVIEPTSPLRTKKIVLECITQLISSNRGSIATYTELEIPYERIWKIQNDKASTIVDKEMAFQPRQTLSKVYKLNGLFYGIKREALLSMSSPKVISEDVIPYITPSNISIDIDTIDDFDYIEFLIKKNGK